MERVGENQLSGPIRSIHSRAISGWKDNLIYAFGLLVALLLAPLAFLAAAYGWVRFGSRRSQ
jgi:hypothetical protein